MEEENYELKIDGNVEREQFRILTPPERVLKFDAFEELFIREMRIRKTPKTLGFMGNRFHASSYF